MFSKFIVGITFALAVSAQTDDHSEHALEILAIRAHFSNAGIVPSPIPAFDPVAILEVDYPSIDDDVTPGQALTIENVRAAPTLSLERANASVTLPTRYTVAMIDAETVGFDQAPGQNRHWLVNGVTLTGDDLNIGAGSAITAYAGPFPAAGSGPHRYVILVYAEPATFTAPATPAPGSGVSRMDFAAYVRSTGLQGPIAGTYIQVEQGTATAQFSSTAAVVTSTLSVARTSGAGTGSSTGSRTGTGTAAGATQTGGAGKNMVSYGVMAFSAMLATYMF